MANRGCSLVAGHGPLILGASPAAQALGAQASVARRPALVAPRHAGPSESRGCDCVPCVGRQILNHWTTRNVPYVAFFLAQTASVTGICAYIQVEKMLAV